MRSCRIWILLGALLMAGGLQAAEKGAEFTVGGFVFNLPKGWQTVEPTSAMRKAELKVSDPKTQAVAETVFSVSGRGRGGVRRIISPAGRGR